MPWPELALVAIHNIISIIVLGISQPSVLPHCPASFQQYRLGQHQNHYRELTWKKM